MAVLLIACSAVVTGARSFAAIDEWAADAPQDVLARLGPRTATALAVRIPPSGATIHRLVKDTCAFTVKRNQKNLYARLRTCPGRR